MFLYQLSFYFLAPNPYFFALLCDTEAEPSFLLSAGTMLSFSVDGVGHCMKKGLLFHVPKRFFIPALMVSYSQWHAGDQCHTHALLWVLMALTGSWGSGTPLPKSFTCTFPHCLPLSWGFPALLHLLSFWTYEVFL